MTKFKVSSDPLNKTQNTSTNIIVNNLNEAAKRLGLYSDSGARVVYDCLGFDYGQNPDAIICVFELPFPQLIINNLKRRPTLGVSRDNLSFILAGGHPRQRASYFNLGVDSKKWAYVYKAKPTNRFRFLAYSESNTRGCLEVTVEAFCVAAKRLKGCELYIKDRSATPVFKSWVEAKAREAGVTIIHDDREVYDSSEILELAATADCAVSINRSSTWNMKAMECLSMGLPTISNAYSGHREYITEGLNGLEVKYKLERLLDYQLEYLQSLGLRNYLFSQAYYGAVPFWADVDSNDLADRMEEMFVLSEQDREKLSNGARSTAEYFTWERSALNLSECLRKFWL